MNREQMQQFTSMHVVPTGTGTKVWADTWCEYLNRVMDSYPSYHSATDNGRDWYVVEVR